ncbi:MAG TPA: hypothetical protein VKQ30_20720 [Ktedonobacterales bacterium]|nr:hypothetical protein [Ktedonobacterales bacterium]
MIQSTHHAEMLATIQGHYDDFIESGVIYCYHDWSAKRKFGTRLDLAPSRIRGHFAGVAKELKRKVIFVEACHSRGAGREFFARAKLPYSDKTEALWCNVVAFGKQLVAATYYRETDPLLFYIWKSNLEVCWKGDAGQTMVTGFVKHLRADPDCQKLLKVPPKLSIAA